GGGVDGEERNLVDLGAEHRELGALGRQRQPSVAGGELHAAGEEVAARREGHAEGEPVPALHRRVRARLVHAVGVAPGCHRRRDDEEDEEHGRRLRARAPRPRRQRRHRHGRRELGASGATRSLTRGALALLLLVTTAHEETRRGEARNKG
ncbi:Os03g0787150, partial [Oryza sativa Japonica Group]